MHCFGLSMMKLTWLSLLKFSTPLTVYVWQNHIHVVHYHTLKVIVYKINNCIYLNYNEMNGIKVITLMRERMHATENLVIIHNCGFIGNLRSSFTMNSFQSLTYYSEFLPSFHVLLTSYAVLIFLLCLSTFFLPSWNTFTCFHNFFLFSPLSFSPFFLQEPQTTVIHNPVDGIKVHPPPFCPHIIFLYWFSFVIVVPTLFL